MSLKSSRCQTSLRVVLITVVLLTSVLVLCRLFHAEPEKEIRLTSESTDPARLKFKHEHEPVHHIYIDIGCYNGETIEHFIHFMADSDTYDIITFEPEPRNYQLCKQTLEQKKYEDYNITILPQAVWIRDEPVFFQVNRGRHSRINGNIAAANHVDVKQVEAIDFSSWLVALWKPNRTKIFLKMSLPGAEIPVLEKMFLDGTVDFIHKVEIEWADRENPHLRARRIYIQLMFDNRGFDALYYTRLLDARRTYKLQGSFNDLKKHFNWKTIEESDTFAHYRQRPEEEEMLQRTSRRKVKF